MNVSEFSRRGGVAGTGENKILRRRQSTINYKPSTNSSGQMDHLEFSRKGGEAGTGASKRRSAAHYRRLAQLGVAARRLKQFANRNGEGAEVMRNLTEGKDPY